MEVRGDAQVEEMSLRWMNCLCSLVTEHSATDAGRLGDVVMGHV